MQATIRDTTKDAALDAQHDANDVQSANNPKRPSGTRRYLTLLVVAAFFLVVATMVRIGSTVIQHDYQSDRTLAPAQPSQAVQATTVAHPAPAAAPVTEQSARFGKAQTPQELIDQMQQRIEHNDSDYDAYAQLGLLLLQRVRSGADASDYQRADQALSAALALEPNEVDALVGKGILALALHHFAEGLDWAKKAQAVNPLRPDILGIMTDAHVELGHYDEAVTVLQQMVDMRPGVNSYSRVAYLRELYGDVDGAIEAMKMAAHIGLPGDEPTLWTTVQLGNLYLNRGDLHNAEQVYQSALDQSPAYVYALAGMAAVWAAQGRTEDAIAQYREVVTRIPLPQFAIALGELLESTGDSKGAQEQYELVEVVQTLNESAGMNVDLEMALFTSDHGKDMAAALAQAQAAYAERKTIYGADVLAWALYRNGQAAQAQPYMKEAMRLGTQDARLFYHAGMIALAQGDKSQARQDLEKALAINPNFSPLYSAQVQKTLAELQ